LPVVRVAISRLAKMAGTDRRRVIDRLPYLGLDIEGMDRDSVRVEYSPNRPDFGTDFGIARSLRGVLGKEVGLPKFPTVTSGISVSVDRRLLVVRPYIACATASGLRLDDEDVRQIISLQEDLHNGLGRKRRAVAVGLHDLDKIEPPLSYRAVDSSFEFAPLGARGRRSIESILVGTPEGRTYGPILGGSRLFPVITDSAGVVLSFPPVINGSATAVTTKTRRVFVDVTSTEEKAGDDVLAVLATTLAEAGGKLGTVKINHPSGSRVTPDLGEIHLALDVRLVRSILGLDLSRREIARALAKSRLGVRGNQVSAPRYRVDLLHPVDVTEEVALGYGFHRIDPVYPPSKHPGSFNAFEDFLDSLSTVMAESGMIELMTYELTNENSLYSKFQRPSPSKITVQNPKSLEHSVLRDALIPSLMASLSGNAKSDYPQRVFEIGRVYGLGKGTVSESWHLGCLVAHSQSSFTEAKMHLESLCRIVTGREAAAKGAEHWGFASGRCAKMLLNEEEIGYVGELKPEVIAAFGLAVPVSGFELDLSRIYELLK
jgi:phenylalanyl-tRNA synthetase beta chain